MSFKIEMPHVGESVTEAVIDRWLKQPGDRIEKYEPIVEVITDKVAMEIPAPASGTLTSIVAGEGETVAMGAVIAEMDAEGVENAPVAQPEQPVVEQSSPTPDSPSPSAPRRSAAAGSSGLRVAPADRIGTMITAANVGPTGGAFSDTSLAAPEAGSTEAGQKAAGESAGGRQRFARLSPAVRRLIDSNGLDPAQITGTGVGGRITRADVLQAVERQGSPSDSPTSVADGRLEKPSPVRQMIAEHMSKSFREIPHAWSAVEVGVSGLVACRSANLERVQNDAGVRLTYLPFALGVTARALKSNPLLNASWRSDGILMHDEINVGIAVAGRDGLVVPVVRQADTKSIVELATELAGVIERARNGKLSLADVSGGTFTLNNTGALGSVWGGAIINHPQAAILTTEAIVRRPVATSKGEVEVRPMMNICLSFDHRVIDGAEASAFLQDVKSGLEAFSADSALE